MATAAGDDVARDVATDDTFFTLYVYNFRNLNQGRWVFPRKLLYAIRGESGVGKTTWLAAIVWVLTGKGSAKSLQQPNQHTIVTFEYDGWKILRQRKPGLVRVTKLDAHGIELENEVLEGDYAQAKIDTMFGSCWFARAVKMQYINHVLLNGNSDLQSKLALLSTIGCDLLPDEGHNKLKKQIAESQKEWQAAQAELKRAQATLAETTNVDDRSSLRSPLPTIAQITSEIKKIEAEAKQAHLLEGKKAAWREELAHLPSVADVDLAELLNQRDVANKEYQELRRMGERWQRISPWLHVTPISPEEWHRYETQKAVAKFFADHNIHSEAERIKWLADLEARYRIVQRMPERQKLVFELTQAQARLKRLELQAPKGIEDVRRQLSGARYKCPECSRPLDIVSGKLAVAELHCPASTRKALEPVLANLERQEAAWKKDVEERILAAQKVKLYNEQLANFPQSDENASKLNDWIFRARSPWCREPAELKHDGIQAWTYREEIQTLKSQTNVWSEEKEKLAKLAAEAAQNEVVLAESNAKIAARRADLQRWLETPSSEVVETLARLQSELVAAKYDAVAAVVKTAEVKELAAKTEYEGWITIRDTIAAEERLSMEPALKCIEYETNLALDELFGFGICQLSIAISREEKSGRITTTCKPTVILNGMKYTSLDILSGGEQSRVSLALLLCFAKLTKVPFLLLDEPFAGLSPTGFDHCINALKTFDIPSFVIFHGHYEYHFDHIESLD